MSLRAQMIGFCLLIGLAPLAGMGIYAVNVAGNGLESQASDRLASLREAKKAGLDALLGRWKLETEMFAASKEVYNALSMLRDATLGVVEGQRLDLEDEEYVGNRDYLAPAFAPFVEKLGFPDAYLIGDHG